MSRSKYTKSKKKLKRKKYQMAGSQYALPTSIASQGPLATNVQANLSDDPAKAKKSLIDQNLSERELQKLAKEDREKLIQERRDRNKQQMQAQGLQLGDEVAKLAKDKLTPKTVGDLASSLATAPTLLPGASSTAATGISSAGAQSLATQGSGMSAAFGQKALEQQLKTELTKNVGKEVGKTVATEGAKKGIQMGASSSAVNPIALAANLGGTALKTFGGDDDDTTYNTAEVSGGLLKRAGEFGGYGAALGTILPGLGNVVGGIAGGVIGLGIGAGEMLKNKEKAIKEKDKLDAKEAEAELLAGTRESELFRQAYGTTGRDLGFNVNQQSQNSYLGSNQMFKSGGRKQLQAGMFYYQEPGPSVSDIGSALKDKVVSTTRTAASSVGVPSNLIAMSQNTLGIDTPMGIDMFNNDEQEEIRKLIKIAEEKGRSYVTYDSSKPGGSDYPDAGNVFKQNSLGAYTEPNTSVRTTLGQFGFKKQEDGSYDVKDSYGFNKTTNDADKVTDYSAEQLKEMSSKERYDIGMEHYKDLNSAQAQYNTARYFVAPYGYNENTPVNFNISMREGGKVSQYKKGGKKVPGGEVIPLPGGAVEFKGNKHFESGNGSDSGIILEKSTATKQGVEVENGETMDKVEFKDGRKDDYIFSEYLKLGGVSFAQRHKNILKKGGNQKEIQQLAKLQEEKAKQVGKTPVGPTDQYGARGKEYIARYGGVKPRKMAQVSMGFAGGAQDYQYNESYKRAEKAYGEGEKQQRMEIANNFQQAAVQKELYPIQPTSGQTYDSQSVVPEYLRSNQNNQTRSAAPAQSTGSAPTNQQPPSGVEYKDELVNQDGVQYSNEDFKRKGRGSYIDYSGDIKGSSWKDVLKSNWAENIVGDKEVNSKEDLQKIYNEDYVPQVKEFFENNPEQAYNSIVEFANSGNPNASNLKKRIYKNGKLLSEDEVLAVGLKNATDGKVGTFHSLFTGAPSQEEIVAPDPKTEELPTNVPDAEIKDFPEEQPEEVKKASLQLKAPRVRDIPPLAYLGAASQALGPAMALATKYKQPERVSSSNIGKEQLARVNYNAERAANLNNNTATTRHIQNNVSGPGGIAAILAGNEASRSQFVDIANKEAAANRQIQNAETQMNTQIAARNVANNLQAQSRNAQAQNLRDQAEYEKRINAYGALGDIGGQFASDALQYKAVNRQARANQIAGEFTRQEYTEALSKRPKYRRMLKKAGIDPNDMRSVKRIAANMWDPTLTQEELDQKVLDYAEANKNQEKDTDKKRAGGQRKYTKRTGKIRRKK